MIFWYSYQYNIGATIILKNLPINFNSILRSYKILALLHSNQSILVLCSTAFSIFHLLHEWLILKLILKFEIDRYETSWLSFWTACSCPSCYTVRITLYIFHFCYTNSKYFKFQSHSSIFLILDVMPSLISLTNTMLYVNNRHHVISSCTCLLYSTITKSNKIKAQRWSFVQTNSDGKSFYIVFNCSHKSYCSIISILHYSNISITPLFWKPIILSLGIQLINFFYTNENHMQVSFSLPLFFHQSS